MDNNTIVVGMQVDQYRLLEKIGEGGMAVVFNAFDERMECNVAIKFLLYSRKDSMEFFEQFANEARTLAQLSHTNIVKVLGYGDHEGIPYLVLEYFPGGTLRDLTGKAMHWSIAASILAPVARALDYVHQQKLIHRDVKPSNILLGENDEPMLSDFGIVKLMENEADEEQVTGVGIGTPDYMSPEQGIGKEVDFRADIYALGVVFFELLTGEKPFSAETPMAVAIQHVTNRFPKPADFGVRLPKVVVDVLMKAVAKDPNKRYTNMGQFAEGLERLSLGEKMNPAAVRKIVFRKSKREMRLRYFSLASFVLLISIFSGYLGYQNQTYLSSLYNSYSSLLFTAVAPESTQPTRTPFPSLTPILLPTRTPKPTNANTIAPTAEQNLPTATLPRPKPTMTEAPIHMEVPYIALEGTQPPPLTVASLRLMAMWGNGRTTEILYSPDGKLIAMGTTNGVFIYRADDFSHQYYLNTEVWVETILFSNKHELLYVGLRTGVVQVWNTSTGQKVREIKYDAIRYGTMTEALPAPAKALAVSTDFEENFLAIGYDNGVVRVFSEDAAYFNLINSVASSYSSDVKSSCVRSNKQGISGLAFDQDSRYLYVVNGTDCMNVYDLDNRLKSEEIGFKTKQNEPINVSLLKREQKGSYLFVAGQSSVFVYSLSGHMIVTSYIGSLISSIAISPSADRIAVGSQDGQIDVFEGPAVSRSASINIPVYTIELGHQELDEPDRVISLAFSADGAALVSASVFDMTFWDVSSGKKLDLNIPENLGCRQPWQYTRPPIKSLAFSRDFNTLVVEYENEGVSLWRVSTGCIYRSYEGLVLPPKGNFFSKTNRYMVLIQKEKYEEQSEVKVFDYSSGNLVISMKGFRSDDIVGFSDDESMFVVGNMRTVRVWDASTWERVDIKMGMDPGCTRVSTKAFPDEPLVHVLSFALWFDMNKSIDRFCYTPLDAVGLAASSNYSNLIFRLNRNGKLWAWNLNERVYVDQKNDFTFEYNQNPEVLLALSYAGQAMIKVDPNKDVRLVTFPNTSTGIIYDQDDYGVKAAISDEARLIAFGSKYGTITLWAKP